MSDTKQHRIIIAIDGFSSCGKSTFAKAIAARLGYIFIDTGAMYRAVTHHALEHVMDGRDIGTVVFPDAELKIFMTADPAVRARRRYDELRAKGDDVSLEEIERNVRERDRADMSRAVSPLRQAPDAVVLDNSRMSVEEQMAWFMELFERRIAE